MKTKKTEQTDAPTPHPARPTLADLSCQYYDWDGKALLRNLPDDDMCWLLLNSTGKWQNGMEPAARMMCNGDVGFKYITYHDAVALAAKLGGNLDDAQWPLKEPYNEPLPTQ